MAGVTVKSNITQVMNRFVKQVEGLQPDSQEFKAALFKIGNDVKNTAIDNITSVGAVGKTGILRSSINFDIVGSGNIQTVTVGAFGVKYARIVELGGVFTDRMRRAMFASFAEQGGKKRPGKGIIQSGYYKARPFIGPAVRENKENIRGILMELGRGD